MGGLWGVEEPVVVGVVAVLVHGTPEVLYTQYRVGCFRVGGRAPVCLPTSDRLGRSLHPGVAAALAFCEETGSKAEGYWLVQM